MKLTLLVSALALALGMSSVHASGESIPKSDPNQHQPGPASCDGLFETAFDDSCTRPPPPPTGDFTHSNPAPVCGEYTLTLTVHQVFPDLVVAHQRASAEGARLRAQLAQVEQYHQWIASEVYRLAPTAGRPYSPAYQDALNRLEAIARDELALRRAISEIERYRSSVTSYLGRVGTQTVRNQGCVSLGDGIASVRRRLGAPPL